MSTPVQPLTSLDWYRQALDESANRRRNGWLRWFRGLSFLLFHVSLYAISIVLLFAVDLIRSPGSLWIVNVALAWAVLIVVHAAIVGLIWAIGLLQEDESSEKHDLRWSSATASPGRRAKHEEPQDADFRMAAQIPGTRATTSSTAARAALPTTTTTVAAESTQSWSSIKQPSSAAASAPAPLSPPAASPESPWSGWEPASPATVARQALEGDRSGERASWTEASAAAWLTRASGTTTTAPSSANPSSDSDTLKRKLSTRLERRNAGRAGAPEPQPSDDEASGMPHQ